MRALARGALRRLWIGARCGGLNCLPGTHHGMKRMAITCRRAFSKFRKPKSHEPYDGKGWKGIQTLAQMVGKDFFDNGEAKIIFETANASGLKLNNEIDRNHFFYHVLPTLKFQHWEFPEHLRADAAEDGGKSVEPASVDEDNMAWKAAARAGQPVEDVVRMMLASVEGEDFDQEDDSEAPLTKAEKRYFAKEARRERKLRELRMTWRERARELGTIKDEELHERLGLDDASVYLRHVPSGTFVSCCTSDDQEKNRELARGTMLKRLVSVVSAGKTDIEGDSERQRARRRKSNRQRKQKKARQLREREQQYTEPST